MRESAHTYYDWLADRIENLAEQGKDPDVIECLKAAPSLFTLLLAILRDQGFTDEIRRMSASVLSYFLLPTDLIPEAFLGVEGLTDDIYLAALFFEKVGAMGYLPKLQALWPAKTSLSTCISLILKNESRLVTPDIAASFRKALSAV